MQRPCGKHETHMRLCHPDIVEEVIQKAIRVHGMERGEELLAVVKGRPMITVETKEMATLDKCLNYFK